MRRPHGSCGFLALNSRAMRLMLRCTKARGAPPSRRRVAPGSVWTFAMSAQTADSEFAFKLPSLSYIDAEWEDHDLRVDSASPQGARKRGLAGWWSRQAAALVAWRRNNEAARELSAM